MIKEEAIRLLKWVLNEGTESEDLEYHGVSVKEALEVAIKELEQEPILDKIRAEIEQTFLDDGSMQEYTVEECLRIIDKYEVEE